MIRRLFKRSLLVLLLGTPVCWYLFLQLFGENEFELAVVAPMKGPCLTKEKSVYLIPSPLSILEQNELRRLKLYLKDAEIPFRIDSINCFPDSIAPPAVLLVDQQNNLRGWYGLSIKEIDRAMVETDLLLSLDSEDDND